MGNTPMERTPTPVLTGNNNSGVVAEPMLNNSGGSGFLSWPTPKALVFWLAILGAIAAVAVPIASAFFVRATVYEVDKQAQQMVNARVEQAQAVITVQLGALQKQVDESREEQKKQAVKIEEKIDRLLDRR